MLRFPYEEGGDMIETRERVEAASPEATIDLSRDAGPRRSRKGLRLAMALFLVIAGLAAGLLITQPWAGPSARVVMDSSTVEQREQAFRSGLRELSGPSSPVDLSDDAFRHPFQPSGP